MKGRPNLMKYGNLKPTYVSVNPTNRKLVEAQNELLRHDMQIIYSMMLIELQEGYGFNQDELEKFLNAVQDRWVTWAAQDRTTREHPLEMCERITGIQLKGIWEDDK